NLPQLLRGQKTVGFIANQNRRGSAQAFQPKQGFLKQCFFTDQIKKLFGVQLTRHGPEAGSVAAGHDDRENHKEPSQEITISKQRRVISTERDAWAVGSAQTLRPP